MRLPGYWPHGLLNVPVGTMNTAILIASSVTVVLAWAALKMRQFARYKFYMGITILCGVIFLAVKLAYEWPDKFQHFGAYIKPDRDGEVRTVPRQPAPASRRDSIREWRSPVTCTTTKRCTTRTSTNTKSSSIRFTPIRTIRRATGRIF